MDSASDYIASLNSKNQQRIMFYLDSLLQNYPGIEARIRYKIPFYYRKSWICYLNPVKNDGVELAFVRANELSNEQGLLQFGSRKQVGGIVFFDTSSIPLAAVKEIIQEALLLDEQVAYASKRTLSKKGKKKK